MLLLNRLTTSFKQIDGFLLELDPAESGSIFRKAAYDRHYARASPEHSRHVDGELFVRLNLR